MSETSQLSLEGMHGTVKVPPSGAGFWRHWRAFVGPAVLVSVGYMDPGNWGTDLQAGAQFQYHLLWVVALASFMAVILQIAAARLGIATGKDLAQMCRERYPRWTRWPNWLFSELAIAACDLAEVLGSAVALNLLFHIPLLWAVLITGVDVLLLLMLQRFGVRTIEAVVFLLAATIGVCYFIEIFILPTTHPDFGAMVHALGHPSLAGAGMAYLAIGIIGATVMPHNLYLHSALVQSRKVERTESGLHRALRYNVLDSVVALSLAFLINAAILVLAAMVFYGRPGYAPDTDWIRVAFFTLAPLLGAGAAGILFAIALLASGQSSTITGTLAGQVVMEGFLHWHIAPWLRRLITRLVAIIPAVLFIGLRGDASVTDLLTLSQVVLALQLPFAMVPLLHFTTSRRHLGTWKSGWAMSTLGWSCAALIIAADLYALPGSLAIAWHVLAG